MHIDLNSDLGESYGAWKMGNDEQNVEYSSDRHMFVIRHEND